MPDLTIVWTYSLEGVIGSWAETPLLEETSKAKPATTLVKTRIDRVDEVDWLIDCVDIDLEDLRVLGEESKSRTFDQ